MSYLDGEVTPYSGSEHCTTRILGDNYFKVARISTTNWKYYSLGDMANSCKIQGNPTISSPDSGLSIYYYKVLEALL